MFPIIHNDKIREAPKQFLCQLVSVQASINTIWPWINRKDPFRDFSGEDGIYTPGNTLLIGDLGELSIFLDAENNIFIESACG